jgi:tetratricopeptide (TPR) repeat protein
MMAGLSGKTRMDYYAKAGAIFDKYGWNESNSVLWYNIGETWMDEGELAKAKKAYEKAVDYAKASAACTRNRGRCA